MQFKKLIVTTMTALFAITSATTSLVHADNHAPTNQPSGTNQKWVCSIQAIYLYQHPTFKHHQRISLIKSQDQQKLPVFKVIKTAKSKTNQLRYQVRVLSGQYKNQVGYITTNHNFVQPLYYNSNQIRTVQVIAPKINIYQGDTFKHPVKTVTQGNNVNVIGVKQNKNGRFRFILKHHQYITANQKFVLDFKDANNQNT